MTIAILVVAGAILVHSVFAGVLEKTPWTPPMLFTGLGLLLGASVLGVTDFEMEAPALHLLAEVTLLLVLFADATRIELSTLRHDPVPARLLGIGLPLTIAAGAATAGWLLPGLGVFQGALLGAILAPTDAALGQAVVSNPSVPLRLRRALTVESGLNDGISLPLVLMFAALSSMGMSDLGGEDRTLGGWALFATQQIVVGAVAGLGIGAGLGRVIRLAVERSLSETVATRIAVLAVAFVAYAGAEVAGGNGFVATFCAGMGLRAAAKNLCPRVHEFAEAEGALLTLLAFLLFGAAMVPIAIAHFTPSAVFYALASLTVIRMAPVLLALVGTPGLTLRDRLFVAWFGPRGLASILFVIVVVEEASLPGRDDILCIVVVTVLLSILAHGFSAGPAARAYGRTLGDPVPDPGAATT